MSDDVQVAWVGFATNGDPGVDWQPYRDGGRATVIDAPPALVDEIRAGRCGEVTELVTIRR